MAPERVVVPVPFLVRFPLPVIAPAKVVEALLPPKDMFLEPSDTVDPVAPVKDATFTVGAVMLEIFSVAPAAERFSALVEMVPALESSKVPSLMVVAPE